MAFVAFISGYDMPKRLPVPSDSEARRRVDETQNKELRHERAIAYALLECAFFDLFGENMPALYFSPDGKPSLAEGSLHVSLSHTDGCIAVAFSKNDIGIDAQSYPSVIGKEKVLARFANESLQKELKSAKSAEVIYKKYTVSESGDISAAVCELEPRRTAPAPESAGADTAAVWTRLEALLKCRRGFASLSDAPTLVRAARISTVYLDSAALSVALI